MSKDVGPADARGAIPRPLACSKILPQALSIEADEAAVPRDSAESARKRL